MSERGTGTEPGSPVSPGARSGRSWAGAGEADVEALPEAELTSVQITYVDPQGGNICRRDVFVDPADWEGSRARDSRFLISSDLVNLLNEAVGQRRSRFRARHEQLAKYRFGYTCALQKLRLTVDRLTAMALPPEPEDGEADAEDNGQAEPSAKGKGKGKATASGQDAKGKGKGTGKGKDDAAEGDADTSCPIHYYRPELYLDSYAYERLDVGIRNWRTFLQAQIAEIQDRINELGGAGWYDLLQKLLRKGAEPLDVGDKLLDRIQDDDERWEIEDKISGGLRKKYDVLLPVVDALEVEFADYSQRKDVVENELRSKNAAIAEGENRLREINKQLQESPPYLRPESESEESEPEPPVDNSAFLARVAAMKKALFAEWDEKLREAKAEAARMKALMEDWEGKHAAYDRAALERIEQELRDIESVIAKLKRRIEKLSDKLHALREKMREAEEQVTREKEAMSQLKDKINNLPPPAPKSLKFVKLQRELRALLHEEERIKRKMLLPLNKVKAIRMELRGLYKKLGWEWDFSESEDEEDKPYWMRRKLAENGLTPFNPNDFVYQERHFQGRRLRNQARKAQANRAAHLLSQMVASRHLHSETVANMLKKEMKAIASALDDDSAPGPGPFKADDGDPKVDPIERSLESVQQRLSGALTRSVSPRPSSLVEEAEIHTACARLLRIHQLRSATLEELRQCARSIPEALPDEGPLAALRPRLAALAGALGAGRVEPELLEQGEEAEQELDDLCASVQEVIGQAIRLSDRVQPIAAALQHATRLAELRGRMADLRQQRALALAELKDAAGPEMLAGRSTRLPSAGARSLLEASTSTRGSSAGLPPSPLTSRSGALSPASRLMGGTDLRRQLVGAGRQPPRLEAVCEPLLTPGTASRLGRRRCAKQDDAGSASGREGVDFGFRPDGVGEESLENWSLFKVNKGADMDSGRPSAGGAAGIPGRGMLTPPGKASDTKAAKLAQRIAGNCDFRDYVAQTKQSSPEMWQSASAPDLLASKVKKGPSLPQLVKREQAQGGRQQAAGVDAGGARRTPKAAVAVGGWRASQKGAPGLRNSPSSFL